MTSGNVRRVIVHIGLPKTGSTSIQRTLHAIDGVLTGDAGCYSYLKLRNPNHGVSIASIFSKSPERIAKHRKRGLSKLEIEAFIDEERQRLIDAIGTHPECDAIISAEKIVSLTEGELTEFRSFLNQYFDKIDIVAYIRRPLDYLESAFQQGVKGGDLNELNVAAIYRRFRKRLEKFETVFGSENCYYWKFEPSAFRGKDAVLDFCDRLGIHLESGETDRANESLSLNALKILFAYYKYGPGYGVGPKVLKENTLLLEEIRKIPGGRLRFAPQLILPVLERHKDDISWMEQRLGESLLETPREYEGAISCEEDLLKIDPEAIAALKALIRENQLPDDVVGDAPKDVASMVHILRQGLFNKKGKRNKMLSNRFS